MKPKLSIAIGYTQLIEKSAEILPFVDPYSLDEVLLQLHKHLPRVQLGKTKCFLLTCTEGGAVRINGSIKPVHLERTLQNLASQTIGDLRHIREMLNERFPFKKFSKWMVDHFGDHLRTSFHLGSLEFVDSKPTDFNKFISRIKPYMTTRGLVFRVNGWPKNQPYQRWINEQMKERLFTAVLEEMDRQELTISAD